MTGADPFMSREDIRAFTRTPFKARQAKFLRENGIRHYLDAHGWPVVLWASVGDVAAEAAVATWKPNKAA
jgi:hypothetical protein